MRACVRHTSNSAKRTTLSLKLTMPSLEAEAFVAALPKGELDGRIEEGLAALRELLDPATRTTRSQGRAPR